MFCSEETCGVAANRSIRKDLHDVVFFSGIRIHPWWRNLSNPWFRRFSVWSWSYTSSPCVADWNPAPAGTVNIPLNTGFYTSEVAVWDFFHQQYQLNMKNLAMIFYDYKKKVYNWLLMCNLYRGPNAANWVFFFVNHVTKLCPVKFTRAFLVYMFRFRS